MDHHGPRPGAEGGNLGVEGRARGILGKQLAENQLGMGIGDHRAARGQNLAAGKAHAGGAIARGLDFLDRAAEMHFAAERLQGGDQRIDHGGGAAFPERHAEALVGHRFEIGKQRAAGDVGGEVEMHAPGRHHHLELVVLEAGVEIFARRRQNEPGEIAEPRRALLAIGLPKRLGRRP